MAHARSLATLLQMPAPASASVRVGGWTLERAGRTFLQHDDSGKVAAAARVLGVPEEDGRYASLVVHLAVRVERLIRLYLELAHLHGRHRAVVDGRVVFVRPRRPAKWIVRYIVLRTWPRLSPRQRR